MKKSTPSQRGVYLLPNLFTTASLFAAFYSIVASMQHQFEVAIIAIFAGMVADGLDGRVARLTNTQTEFGAQYDSLSDMVTFGIAPSLLAFSWSLIYLGKIGWLVSFVFTAAVALRLARFNTQLETADKRFFQGLSCTAAGAFIASFIWVCIANEIDGIEIAVPCAILLFCTALLMVSNVRYYSFKDIDFKGRVPFLYALIIVFLFVGLTAYPFYLLFICFCGYVISGPIITIRLIWQLKQARKKG